MKRILSALLLTLSLSTQAGLPPTTLSGQSATSNTTTFNFKTPYNQATKITGGTLIETGNANVLANPGFEHSTFNSSWTCALGTLSLETNEVASGKQSLGVVSSGAGVRCYQLSTINAANLKGSLAQARAMIKTTDASMKVCGLVDGNGAANERNCVTVLPTSTDNVFYPAQTQPFQFGGTSNGIVIYTTTTTNQPTVIDDAHVGVTNSSLASFSNTTQWVPCTFSTLAWVGLGTITNNLQCRRDGPNLKMRGNYTAGTTTASSTQFLLPNNYGSITVGASGGSSYGSFFRLTSTGTNVLNNAIPVASSNYFSLSAGLITAAVNGSTPAAANTVMATGDTATINGELTIPIAGWEANTNAAVVGCTSNLACKDTFRAEVNSSIIISSTLGFIANCSISTNVVTCTYNAGLILTSPMICNGNVAAGSDGFIEFISNNTTGFSYRARSDGGVLVPRQVFITCGKMGNDDIPKGVIISPLNGYQKVPGYDGNVDTFTILMTTTCASGTCPTVPLINGGATVSRVSLGTYNFTTLKTYSVLTCYGVNGRTSAGGVPLLSSNVAYSLNSNTVGLYFVNTSSTAIDGQYAFTCTGIL